MQTQTNRLEKFAQEFDAHNVKRLPQIDFEAWMRTRTAEKDKLKMAGDYRASLLSRLHGDSDETAPWLLPWTKSANLFGFRPGEVTTWVGFNGHYKSMLTGYVMLDIIRHGGKVCIASFEMRPVSTLERLARQAIGCKNPSLDYLDKFFTMVDSKLWFYDLQGSAQQDQVIAAIYYCAEELHIQHIVIDSLMKCVMGEDDMNGQKTFVDKLCAAARELNIHIHLVHHSRKREDESKRPGKCDAKGSGSIVDQTDNFFVVFRIPKEKKENQDDLPDVMLYCDKQRNGEWEGRIALWFDADSMQFKDCKTARTVDFFA